MAINGSLPIDPCPQYFITRPDGTCTPLVAVDELPDSFKIINAPRNLSNFELKDMITLGTEPRNANPYIVIFPTSKPDIPSSPGTSYEDVIGVANDSRLDSVTQNEDEAAGAGASGARRVESWVDRVDNRTVSKYGESQLVPQRQPSPASTQDYKNRDYAPNTYGKKVYCTHWLRHGECDFIQQGCLYKHEMPDELTLKSIGIKPFPRWYMDSHPERFGPGDAGTRYGWGRGHYSHVPLENNSSADSRAKAQPGAQYPFGMDNAKAATSMAAGTFAPQSPHQPPIPWSTYNAAQQSAPQPHVNVYNHANRSMPPYHSSRTAYVSQINSARGIPPAAATPALPPPSIVGSPPPHAAHVNIPKPPSAFNSDRRPKTAQTFHTTSSTHQPSNPLISQPRSNNARSPSIVSFGSVASTVNRHYVPLTPSTVLTPPSVEKTSNSKIAKQDKEGKRNGKAMPATQERVKHRRLFVPPGEASSVANDDGGEWGTTTTAKMEYGSEEKRVKLEPMDES